MAASPRGASWRRLASAAALAAAVAACSEAPVTGRNQLMLVSEDEVRDMGLQAYQEILSKNQVVTGTPEAAMVKEVGRRIAAVADTSGMQWEFNLIQDDTPNAFALPGGKVGVHTGMFKVARNDAQLAAVMGHEIAHATAHHVSERMSREALVQTGLGVIGATTTGANYADLLAAAATLGVVLPFSRAQEAEADEIGMIYMARAGYDPRAAVDLWRNMASAGGETPPEFMSTHPANETRIERLQSMLPRATAEYQRARGGPA